MMGRPRLLALFAATSFAAAQTPELPGEREPLLPEELLLAPVEAPTAEPMPARPLSTDAHGGDPVLPAIDATDIPRLHVRKFFFEGNRAISDRKLAAVVAPWTGRAITADELEAARVALTGAYIQAGYVTSGAILPDQDPSDGIVRVQLVEGKLTKVELPNLRWFRSWWLRNELRRATGHPVNASRLRGGLQVLRQNPLVTQINAELKPGVKPGETILEVQQLREAHPFRLSFGVHNHRPPSVGEGAFEFLAAHLNLTGHNDPLELRWVAGTWEKSGDVRSTGADDLAASYEFPVTPWRTTVRLDAARGATSVVDEAFAALDITSQTEEFGVTLRQVLRESLTDVWAVTFAAQKRRSQSFLLGEPFSLSEGAIDGESSVFALRPALDVINRSPVHVLALRSRFSFGLHAYGATEAETSTAGFGAFATEVPDGKFFTWLGQGQYLRRLFGTEAVVIVRGTIQLSDEPLLAIEQLSLGGIHTIRGYPENQLLRDNGVTGSVEFRVPVLFNTDRSSLLSLATFFDAGAGWNTTEFDDDYQSLSSVGVGLILSSSRYVQASVYWGYPFEEIGSVRDSLQEAGWHFSVVINAF